MGGEGINRRAAVTALAATVFGTASISAVAKSTGMTATLTQLIDEVIAEGNMDNLDNLVAPDVMIAVLGVTNIEEFRSASIQGYESRTQQYEEVTFEVESIAESETWCHALVRFEGRRTDGKMEARTVFYVAQFENDLIRRFFLG